MLTRLSLQNAKRTFGDYAVYVLTVSMVIALNFMVNRLIFSDDLMTLVVNSSGLQVVLGFVTFMMLIVCLSLISYMTKFLLNRRSKEFGLYQLMGIEEKQIKRIYWIEQCYLGAISMAIGIGAGLLLGEILRSIMFNLIGIVEYAFNFNGMLDAALLTAGETLLLYILVKLSRRSLFKSRTILSWLQADKENELIKRPGRGRYILAAFWLVLSIGSVAYLNTGINNVLLGNGIITMSGLACCIAVLLAAVFGLASSIIIIINGFALRGGRQFTLRVLPVRFISKNISARARQIGLMAMIFVAASGLLSTGMMFANYIKHYVREYSGFDFYYGPVADSEAPEGFIDGLERLLGEFTIEESIVFEHCSSRDSELYKLDPNSETTDDFFVAESVYNTVRSMTGYEPVTLKDGEFIIQTHTQLLQAEDWFTEDEYSMLGRTMRLKSLEITPMNTNCVSGGRNYYVVVQDKELAGLTPRGKTYAYRLENDDYRLLESRILDFTYENRNSIKGIYDKESGGYSHRFKITGYRITMNTLDFAVIAVSLLFIGLVFALVLSTILAVLLTSEIGVNRMRFLTLHRLGMSEADQKRVVLRHVLSLFALPVIVGLPLAAAASQLINKLLFSSIMTKGFITSNILLTVIFFTAVYSIYIAVTYRSYRRSVIIH